MSTVKQIEPSNSQQEGFSVNTRKYSNVRNASFLVSTNSVFQKEKKSKKQLMSIHAVHASGGSNQIFTTQY